MKKFWTINNKTYEKVNRLQAEKLFEKGVSITLCVANCNPNYIGVPLMSIVKHAVETPFKQICENYLYYNYTSSRCRKKYCWFFVPVKNRDGSIILSDSNGIYIPKCFIERYEDCLVHSISEEDKEILLNPEHEYYWDTWINVLDNNMIFDKDGERYVLYQDGDLIAIHEGYAQEYFDKLDYC